MPICVYYLEKNGEKIGEVKIGSNMGQRYKIVMPIIEKVKQKGVLIDINILLNPTVSDVRNVLISILSKSE